VTKTFMCSKRFVCLVVVACNVAKSTDAVKFSSILLHKLLSVALLLFADYV